MRSAASSRLPSRTIGGALQHNVVLVALDFQRAARGVDRHAAGALRGVKRELDGVFDAHHRIALAVGDSHAVSLAARELKLDRRAAWRPRPYRD